MSLLFPDTMAFLMLEHSFSQKLNDLWGHCFFMVWEVVSDASVSRALPKDFYAWIVSDIIGYTVSPADMRKRWKPVDEDRTWSQNEQYLMHTCMSFLPATISGNVSLLWIRIRNRSRLSQGPRESDVCSWEQSVLTTLLMRSIMMMDAQTGQGKAEQCWRKGSGCNSN